MYSFLVNPASRSGRDRSTGNGSRVFLRKERYHIRFIFPRDPGDIVRLAEKLTGSLPAGKEDIHLIVLGGDGTANEAVQGIPGL